MSTNDGGQALLSCLSKLTCFHKEDGTATERPVSAVEAAASLALNYKVMTSRDDARSGESSKMEQTKQWLQDLSTVAQYDVTVCAENMNAVTQANLDRQLFQHLGQGTAPYQHHIDGDGYIRRHQMNLSMTSSDSDSQSDYSSYPTSVATGSGPSSVGSRQLATQSRGPITSGNFPHCPMKTESRRRSLPPLIPDGISNPVPNMAQVPTMQETVQTKTNRRRSMPLKVSNSPSCTGSSAFASMTNLAAPHPARNDTRNYCHIRRHPSIASISSATSSETINMELVTVNISKEKSLGITVVGQSGRDGDLGIFVGCVKKGGASDVTGRVHPGDWILEVNGIDLGQLSNDAALEILRRETSSASVVTLLLAKYWCSDGSEVESSISKQGVSGGSSKGGYEVKRTSRGGMGQLTKPVVSSTPCMPARNTVPSKKSSKRAAAGKRDENSMPVIEERNFLEGSGMSSGHLQKNSNALPLTTQNRKVDPLSQRQFSEKPGAVQSKSSFGVHSDLQLFSRIPSFVADSQQLFAFARHTTSNVSHASLHPEFPSYNRMDDVARNAKPPGATFLGVDLVDWIQLSVEGLAERTGAIQYAARLLMTGYILDTQFPSNDCFSEHGTYTVAQKPDQSQHLAIV